MSISTYCITNANKSSSGKGWFSKSNKTPEPKPAASPTPAPKPTIKPITIGLLAGSQSGKSTYNVVLGGRHLRKLDHEGGVQLYYNDPEQQGYIERNFNELVMADNALTVMETSKKTTYFDCSLVIGYGKHSLTMIDFPGEMLSGAKSANEAEETIKTQQALKVCDGFIVLIDGEKLIKAATIGDDIHNANLIKQLTMDLDGTRNLLNQALQSWRATKSGDQKLPLCFVITKHDKVKDAKIHFHPPA